MLTSINIDWVPDNFSAAPENGELACIATGATLADVKVNIVDALKFHFESMKEGHLDIPKEYRGSWEPVFHLTTRAQLKYADVYITRKLSLFFEKNCYIYFVRTYDPLNWLSPLILLIGYLLSSKFFIMFGHVLRIVLGLVELISITKNKKGGNMKNNNSSVHSKQGLLHKKASTTFMVGNLGTKYIPST